MFQYHVLLNERFTAKVYVIYEQTTYFLYVPHAYGTNSRTKHRCVFETLTEANISAENSSIKHYAIMSKWRF